MCILVNSGIDWHDKRSVLTFELISKLNGKNLYDICEFKPFIDKAVAEREYHKAVYYNGYSTKEDFIKSFFDVETSLHSTERLTLPKCLRKYDIINNSVLWQEYCKCLDLLVDHKLKELEDTGKYNL